MSLRSSILWGVREHRLVASYRRFRTTYRPNLRKPSCPRICDRKVVPKRRHPTTNLRCLTSQKSEEPVYTSAEAWYHVNISLFLIWLNGTLYSAQGQFAHYSPFTYDHHHHHHHKHKDWTLSSVPSPELQLLTPTLLRSSNCSPSFWSVVVWFQRDSALWHSLQVWKPVLPVFIYLVQYACNP